MTFGDVRILIVSEDAETMVPLTEHIMTGLNAEVTIVYSIEEAQVMSASNAFDLIVASENLPDGNALSLLGDEGDSDATPLVLLSRRLHAEQVLDALRRGAVDVFTPPIELDRLSEVIRRVAQGRRDQRRQRARATRLRQLSARLIRDRRELRQRVDLICHDLVHAYRRLAEKVVAAQNPGLAEEQPTRIDTYNPNA